jgi:hypothetical protein
MRCRSLVVVTVGLSLLPFGTVSAQPATDAEPVADAPDVAPEGPQEAPAAAPAPAPAPSAPEPEYKGNGLIYAAIGVTGLSWIARMTSLGLTASLQTCTDLDCDGKVTSAAALLYIAPISQFIATGLVVPGGLLKGRHDGWRSVTTGTPARDGKAFVIAGGVVFGVFTALSIALRPIYITSLTNCVETSLEGGSSDCGGLGGLVGYHVGVMLSDTASTTGAGLLSYGLGYNGYRKRYAPKVSVSPFGARGAYGLSLTGRF